MKAVASGNSNRKSPLIELIGRRSMVLGELIRAIPVERTEGQTDIEVRGLAVDSRRAGSGFLFVAMEGQNTDGNLYVTDAIHRGAIAVVSERDPLRVGVPWIQTPDVRKAAGRLSAALADHPAEKIRLVGITGTNGKTTIAYLLNTVFGSLAPPSAMMGTVVYRVGDDARPAHLTTPEAPELQAFLARAVEAGCPYGVLEVSSHSVKLGRLEGCQFACAVFTNLSRDHLDFHRDMESYFAAKRMLFQSYLRPDGTAVIGGDDAYGRRLAETLAGRSCTFGFSADADIRIEAWEATFEGLNLRFRDRKEVRHLRSPLIGRHNALNLLAAYGVGRELGFEPEPLLDALGQARGAPGRYEKVETPESFHVIVDYAHTDDALRNLLETTRGLPHRRVLTVFGAGGDRDRSKRPLMGAVAARLSDLVVLTSDNPRSEDPLTIISEIELGTKGPRSVAEVLIEPDRRKAIRLALAQAGPGDVVLVAGKGHEPYQVIGDRVIPFDDKEVVRQIIAEDRPTGFSR